MHRDVCTYALLISVPDATNLSPDPPRSRLKDGAEFGTRIELRWDGHEPTAAPLGRCDLSFWEDGTRTAAPTCVHFAMQKEACKAWSMMNGDKKVSVLAASLVARLEVFCLRLAASGAGAAVRTKLLCAGWKPEVSTVPFLKRGFRFEGEPDETLGFKMLKSEEARAREAAARQATAVVSGASGGSSDVPASAAEGAATSSEQAPLASLQQLGASGKRKRAEAPRGEESPAGVSPAGSDPSVTPLPLRTPSETPSSAAPSSAAPSSGLPASAVVDSSGKPTSSASAGGSSRELTDTPVAHEDHADESDEPPDEDDEPSEDEGEPAEEWGEISAMGRFATQPSGSVPAASGAAESETLVSTQLADTQPGETQLGATQRFDEMDDVDATMAELLGD